MANDNKRICYFISPHGFGHATRAAAVIRALQQMDAELHVDVVTTAPKGLFDQSVERPLYFFDYASDVGLVQSTPLQEDLPATVRLLDDLLPFEGNTVRNLVEQFAARDSDLIICDIAPLGIAVAREAGVPSLLIENFAWDWIYEAYIEEVPEIAKHITYLNSIFASADFRVRAEPVCGNCRCDLTVSPIFRQPKLAGRVTREMLGIPGSAKMVLVTMGGTPSSWLPKGELRGIGDVVFVVPTSGSSLKIQNNVVMLPILGNFYHPDLVHAADVVITKLGYSTITEVYSAGVPLGYVARPRFRESAVLELFIRERVSAVEIGAESLENHRWAPQLAELLSAPRVQPASKNGAYEVAAFVTDNILCT